MPVTKMMLLSLGVATVITPAVLAKSPVPTTRNHSVQTATASESRAISLVENLKEVRAWKKAFGPKQFNPATNGRPGFSIDAHHGSVYTVYVFEDKPDQVLTFARYDVNVKTGKIKKLDVE